MNKFAFLDRQRVEAFEQEQKKFKLKVTKFSVFVVAALVIVALITGSIFYLNYKNNAVYMFMDASTAAFESGSFDYDIKASIDDVKCMEYKGVMQFDLKNQAMTSSYHAIYEDYEYDCAIYSERSLGYAGTYYGGKWTIENYKSTALDFFDFFRSFSDKEFNAGAFMRFMGNTKTFDAYELENSVEEIFSQLTSMSNINSVLHQDISAQGEDTVVVFEPELDKVFDIIVENIAPAYSSANEYQKFKESVEANQENLKNADCRIEYVINSDGYLSSLTVEYIVNGKNYLITCQLTNFSQATVTLPQGFFTAIDSQG